TGTGTPAAGGQRGNDGGRIVPSLARSGRVPAVTQGTESDAGQGVRRLSCSAGSAASTIRTPGGWQPFRRLHPEHAKAGWLDRRVEGGRHRESEHAAGIGRIDDAVVPQPGGGIPRAALVFILLP